MRTITVLMLCVIISVAVSAVSIWYYDNHYAVHIAAFDLRTYIDTLKKNYADQKIDKAGLRAKIDNLKTVLKNESGRKVVFLKEVIVHGNIETIQMPD